MFGIGGPELVFIFILALLIFGPKRLPQIGRTIGKGMAEFRRASTELQRAVNTELEEPQTPAWRAQTAAVGSASAPLIPSALPAGTVAVGAASPAPDPAQQLAEFGAALEADAAQQAAEPAPESAEPTPGSAESAPEPVAPTQLQ